MSNANAGVGGNWRVGTCLVLTVLRDDGFILLVFSHLFSQWCDFKYWSQIRATVGRFKMWRTSRGQ